MKCVKQASALCALIGIIGGAVYLMESRYASADGALKEESARIAGDQKLQQRVEANERQQLIYQAQSEVYFLKSQARKYPEDAELRDELYRAQDELKELKK